MESIREQLQLFTRRFGLLNASCCDECCGEQISMTQSHILSEIRRSVTPSMQQVAEELGIDITTFSRQVKSLEAKELVTRLPSPEDRRVTLLTLTRNGTDMLDKIDSFMVRQLEDILGQMTPFERDTVTRSLTLLNVAIHRNTQPGQDQKGSFACCK